MKRYFSWLAIFLLSCLSVFSQSIVRFKASKPYAVFSFLETAGGTAAHSATFKRFIDTSISRTDTVFSNMVGSFRELNLNYNYRREEYPANRRQTRSTYDLIVIAAVKSNTLAEFKMNTIGILSNSAHMELFRLLNIAAPYYEKLVWKQSEKAVSSQIAEFRKYEPRASELFRSFRTLYHSTWPDDIPFDVSVFPVPAKTGSTSATPHANSLCVAILTGSKDFAGTMGVTMHEICHVLYDEQPEEFQHRLDSYFTNSSSPFKSIAYSFFDEAMATALGNGVAYEGFSGKTDTTSWYNNEYIDGFGHALYPLVREYLAASKPMDSVFVERAIALFGKTYPRSLFDYSVLLNNMFLYSDGEDIREREALKKVLGKYFQSSRYSFSSPILHEYSIESLKNSRPAQLIVVDRNQDGTISELKKTLPELESLLKDQASQNYIAAFYDHSKRPVVLVRVASQDMLDKAFRLLKQKQYLDPDKPVFTIE